MTTIKMIIEYDGTRFFGWQRQSKKRSVQGDIERVLSKIYKCDITIDGAGRTDAGVHALGQVATFHATEAIPLNNLKRAMNNFLSSDIRILSLDAVDDDFHARYSAVGKRYVYKVLNRKDRHVFQANYAYHYPYVLDDEKIKRCIPYLVGEHNFKSFMATGSSAQNPVREIYAIDLSRQGDELEFVFYGNGFLYKMVRILTAFLLEVGQGHIEPEMAGKILENPSRQYTSKIAPAMGLYLKEVYYK